MTWRIEFEKAAEKELQKLNKQVALRIVEVSTRACRRPRKSAQYRRSTGWLYIR